MRLATGARAAWAAWTCAAVVSVALIGSTRYVSRDPDSRLHADISARLSQQPVERWIAPEWWGFWNMQGPYCEHPAGIFLLPAVVARIGYPAEQAAYAVNVLYQVASLVLIVLIAQAVARPIDARALAWLLQLLPIAFVFRIRANHEYALLAGLLLAIYSTERARSSPRWIFGMLAGFGLVLLVKGIFAGMVPVTCAVWLVARARQPSGARGCWPAWAAIVLMPIVGALGVWGYEGAYARLTGRSFLAVYRERQLPPGALTAGAFWWRVPYTAVWYLGRIVWYAFPWSVVAGWLAVRAVRDGDWWPWLSRGGERANRLRSRLWQGAWFAIVSGLALTASFSLGHRKADRYIFPVYFILGAAGAVSAVDRVCWLGRVVERLDRPWVPAACYLALFLVALLTAGSLPTITFWRH